MGLLTQDKPQDYEEFSRNFKESLELFRDAEADITPGERVHMGSFSLNGETYAVRQHKGRKDDDYRVVVGADAEYTGDSAMEVVLSILEDLSESGPRLDPENYDTQGVGGYSHEPVQ